MNSLKLTTHIIYGTHEWLTILSTRLLVIMQAHSFFGMSSAQAAENKQDATPYVRAAAYSTRYRGPELSFVLFLDEGKNIKAGGENGSGQLGDGTLVDRPVPVLVGESFIDIKKSTIHSLGLHEDGTLHTWGSNFKGALGNGSSQDHATPTAVLGNISSIATGASNSLAVSRQGDLWAWGENFYGQLGVEIGRIQVSSNTLPPPIRTPVVVGTEFSRIVAGYDHALGIKRDGSLWAWGSWQKVTSFSPPGVNQGDAKPAKLGSGFTALAAGSGHALGIKDDGSLWGWGYGWAAGAESRTGLVPQPTQIGAGFKAVGADIGLSVALAHNGKLLMWGEGGQYQTLYSPAVSMAPKLIGRDFTHLLDVGAGLKTDGSLWLWGAPQLLQGSTETFNATGSPYPADVVYRIYRQRPTQIGSDFKQVSVGGGYLLGLKTNGRAWAWGRNTTGQLGDGTTEHRYSPVRIGEGFIQLEASSNQTSPSRIIDPIADPDSLTSTRSTLVDTSHSLGIMTDGSLWSWGSNRFGQLGLGDRNSRSKPTRVGDNFRSVSAGAFHSVGIKHDDTLWAWGNNQYGRLGDGSFTDKPSPVLIGSGYIAVKADEERTVAIKRDGSVWIWGNWPYGFRRDGVSLAQNTYPVPTKLFDGLKPVSESDFSRAVLQTAYSDGGIAAKALGASASPLVSVATFENSGQVNGSDSFGLVRRMFLGEDGGLWQARPDFCEILGVHCQFKVNAIPNTVAFRSIASDGGETLAAIGKDNTLWVLGETTYGQMPIPAIPYFTVPRHSVILDPLATQQAVCLFDWAQVVYPTLFSPPGNLHESSTAPGASYLFRAFPGTQSYLGVADGVLYYLGPASNNTIARIGLVADWLERSACD